MGVNSLPKTVTGERRDCDLNPGPSAPESSTLITRLPISGIILEMTATNGSVTAVEYTKFVFGPGPR